MQKTMIGLIAIAALVSPAAQGAPVTEADFQVETTGSLVSLCSAAPTDPLYTPAVNFCHGFAVGTYRMIATEEAALKSKRKMFCMPPTPPNRNEAIASFVQWASNRPKMLGEPPSDSIVEYLAATYPCK